MMKKLTLLILITITFYIAKAQVRLPRIFSNHMVIQQYVPVHVWGWATSGEKITVTLGSQKATTKAGKEGTWKVSLPEMKAGGPFELIVKGKNKITLNDVMVGEVWLCAGQSNMQFEMNGSKFAKTELFNSDNPRLRHIKIPNTMKAEPADDLEGGEWQISSPQTSGEFSAVAYYFGKKLAVDLNVTVGLINASWGGTFIEAWTGSEALHSIPDFSGYHDLSPTELENWFSGIEKKYDELFLKLGISNRDSIVEDSASWRRPDFDDSKWISVQLPQRFDYDLLPRFDGVAWFRREISIPENVVKSDLTIHVGRIDDENTVFMNGKKLGENLQEYKTKVLKSGKNVIAIRIKDYWERGGFLDPASDFKISSGNWKQSLAGEWKMGIGNLSFLWIRTPSAHPNLIYNGMLSPIFQYPFKGAIWYQGENNVLFAKQYRDVIPVMISDWRKHFCSGEFPFYLVQLPNMNSINQDSQHGGSDWAELRESQTAALKLPNTGMAVAIDLGDSTNNHPTDKTVIANRLGLLALKYSYQQNLGEVNSPMMVITKFDGNKGIVSFKNIGSGLVVHNKYGYVKGFEVAGADQKFHFAKSFIQGDRVIVSCDLVSNPVALRYAWSNNPSDANLYNQEGFPAAPFRTDDWKLITEESVYQNWIK